ncbi:agmatinase [candidate division KSB1 bacterium]|nr:agmatinase [candidate division KSB1 bacterium]
MIIRANKSQFLSSELIECTLDDASIVLIPAPLEKTVSYGKGTSGAPAAILEASDYLELYDDELDGEPFQSGIFTAEALSNDLEHQQFLNALEQQVSYLIDLDKKPVIIGGEHSLSIAPIQAFYKKWGSDFSIIHFDAHADLRDRYEGTNLSHACVMRRVCELGIDVVSIGIRSISREEIQFNALTRHPICFARDIVADPRCVERALHQLRKNVYISLDIDVFDPSVISQTGTPEPGGLTWYQMLTFLKKIADLNRRVLGFDVVEFAPAVEHHHQSYTCAKLIYKMMAYFWRQVL